MRALLLLTLLGSSPAAAEVVSSAPNGFHIRHTVDLAAPPADAYRAFGEVAGWWNPDHTYSGASSNLSLQLAPGGCFCERYGDGAGIEHLRVTYVDPGKRAVLTGALGPLLFEGVAGALDVQWKPAGTGTRFTFDYKVAGFANAGADKLAPIVDQVLAEQVKRYAAYVSAPGR